MKRITWIAMLSVAALIAAGCKKTETDSAPDPAVGSQPADSGAVQPPGGSGLAEPPAGPRVPEPPAEDDTQGKPKQGVAGAIGRALLKGVTSGSKSEKEDPAKAPSSQP